MKSILAIVLASAFLSTTAPAPVVANPAATLDPDPTLPPLRGQVERFHSDLGNLNRHFHLDTFRGDLDSRRRFFLDWRERLNAVDYESLDGDNRIDYLLFEGKLTFELQELDHQRYRLEEIQSLLPFHPLIVALAVDRREINPIDSASAATQLMEVIRRIDEKQEALKAAMKKTGGQSGWDRKVANRAAREVENDSRTLKEWHDFYDGYDPAFSWWMKQPFAEVMKKLEAYARFIREDLVGIDKEESDPVIGDPIGRTALLNALARERIDYTPEELIEIGRREMAWCDHEMKQASRELGFGEDWRKALRHVKDRHVEPGQQPLLIKKLALETEAFLDARDLVTIPQLCRDTWRMGMMSPKFQKVTPYFTGGEVISVSFPTADMNHEDKLMSLRSNNEHFSRATVHHEIIPGHHLQLFMLDRYRAHRQAFRTPFLVEGWCLYWEMLLWDLDFPRSPEDRIGMLFWRKHRCARIIFSLSFHLRQMDAQQAIAFLIENVGHERNNATAEVRRSVNGSYAPLYQAAYMVGGLQLRALRHELVDSGTLTDKEFHDAVLRQNAIPIVFIRAALKQELLPRGSRNPWRFYGNP